MKGEHTPTIIQLILSTDLSVIQLKDSHLILHFSQQSLVGKNILDSFITAQEITSMFEKKDLLPEI